MRRQAARRASELGIARFDGFKQVMILSLLLVLAGTLLLLVGGEALVRGAASLARSVGVSAMVVGLTVVALGTSAPEFAVSVLAAWRDNPAICAGNIVGSNILNILVVLGATAVICPLRAEASFVRREVPVMLGVSVLFWIAVSDGSLTFLEGLGLLSLLAIYTAVIVLAARREKAAVRAEYNKEQPAGRSSIPLNLFFVVIGVGLLVGGSEVFLRGAVGVAEWLGVSETIIGLTLVAIGTSLPELAASVVAAWRKHPDICLGNLVGSCIYNLLWIGGTAGMIRTLPFGADMIRLHVPVMVVSAVVLWPMVATGRRVSRGEGLLLLVFYAAYLTWTIQSQVL
jgi:cation:H+ antiporter